MKSLLLILVLVGVFALPDLGLAESSAFRSSREYRPTAENSSRSAKKRKVTRKKAKKRPAANKTAPKKARRKKKNAKPAVVRLNKKEAAKSKALRKKEITAAQNAYLENHDFLTSPTLTQAQVDAFQRENAAKRARDMKEQVSKVKETDQAEKADKSDERKAAEQRLEAMLEAKNGVDDFAVEMSRAAIPWDKKAELALAAQDRLDALGEDADPKHRAMLRAMNDKMLQSLNGGILSDPAAREVRSRLLKARASAAADRPPAANRYRNNPR